MHIHTESGTTIKGVTFLKVAFVPLSLNRSPLQRTYASNLNRKSDLGAIVSFSLHLSLRVWSPSGCRVLLSGPGARQQRLRLQSAGRQRVQHGPVRAEASWGWSSCPQWEDEGTIIKHHRSSNRTQVKHRRCHRHITWLWLLKGHFAVFVLPQPATSSGLTWHWMKVWSTNVGVFLQRISASTALIDFNL